MDLERKSRGGDVELVAKAGNVEAGGNMVAASEMRREMSLVRLVFACMVAGGVQYGWALQLSLLTPYVQTLGLSHALSSLMWLCGPVAGFVVQPIVGLYSDKCQSKFGRRRPYILAGCLLICLSVIVIGFSSDIGYALGDTKEDCSVYHGARWKAAIVFVVGFWILDFANNCVQGPARALMADLSGRHGCNAANAIFASWMAVGNILGYSSGSTGQWHNWFPFLKTKACCAACANLKGAFLVAVLSWFPFILYDTDWMGREVFHGDPKGTQAQIDAFNSGVRAGAFGLLLNSIVLGIGSFMIEPLCRKFTPRLVWVASNFMVCIAMAGTTIISAWSFHKYNAGVEKIVGPDGQIRAVALVLFTALGLPLAVLYSVPFAVTATLAANLGGGQGLCTGILNISIVVPQVIVALGAGPWDQLFGKGNTPAFALASAFAFVCGFLGLFMLPKFPRSNFRTSGMGGMH